MNKVSLNSNDNNMTSKNLGVVIGVNLLRNPNSIGSASVEFSNKEDVVREFELAAGVVEDLIENYDAFVKVNYFLFLEFP